MSDFFNSLGKIEDDDIRNHINDNNNVNNFTNYDITDDPHLNYSLEQDSNFNNYDESDNESGNYKKTNIPVLRTLGKNYVTTPSSYLIEQDKIKETNEIGSFRNCDSKGEITLRISLEDGLTKTDLFNLIYIIGDCSFKINVGGHTKLEINGLFLSMLLGKKLNKEMFIYRPKTYIKEVGEEQRIQNAYREENEYMVKMTEKYTYYNIEDTYLNIPLMEDFFLYGMDEQHVALPFSEVYLGFNIPKNKLDVFKTYVKGFSFYYNSIIFNPAIVRKNIVATSYEYIILQPQQQYMENYTKLNLQVNNELLNYVKFIFIILRPSSQSEEDVNYTQLPTIEKITAITSNNKEIYYDSNNFWIMDLLKFRIIGIAADDTSNMNNWEEFHKECITFLEKIKTDLTKNKSNEETNKEPNKSSMLNTKYNSKFRFQSFNNINITFTPYDIPISVQVFTMRQNIYSVKNGEASLML